VSQKEEIEWVPVTEGMPVANQAVMVTLEDGYVIPDASFREYKGKQWWAFESGDVVMRLEDVIAWSNYPKGYRP
jgi:hypothetical protein